MTYEERGHNGLTSAETIEQLTRIPQDTNPFRQWVMLDPTSNSGKTLWACTNCGHTTPAPTTTHICERKRAPMTNLESIIPTRSAEEEFVREHWETVKLFDAEHVIDIYIVPPGQAQSWREDLRTFTSWSKAVEFTRKRLEQIRLVEIEINWLSNVASLRGSPQWERDAYERILAREQAALTELRRGMK